MKEEPLRMCIVCRQMKHKEELIKIVKNKNGLIEIDETMKKQGRGAYICKNSECIQTAINKKYLNRSFKTSIDDSIYENLKDIVQDE